MVAGSEGNDALLYFDPPDFTPRLLTSSPGGFISLLPWCGKGRRCLLVSADFKPGFKAERSRILFFDLDRPMPSEGQELMIVPFLHRLELLGGSGSDHLILSTLCSGKKDRDDWSQPGSIQVSTVPGPGEAPSNGRLLKAGLTKNHGLAALPDRGPLGRGFLISAQDGLFRLDASSPKPEEWSVELLVDGPHSDACPFDWDGTGQPQIFAITPFHGNQLVYHRSSGDAWSSLTIADDLARGHILWAGSFPVDPAVVTGSRDGQKEIRVYRRVKENPLCFRPEIIDAGVSPTQIAVATHDDTMLLFVAAQGEEQVLLYEIADL